MRRGLNTALIHREGLKGSTATTGIITVLGKYMQSLEKSSLVNCLFLFPPHSSTSEVILPNT